MNPTENFVNWPNLSRLSPKQWVCGACGSLTGNDKGYSSDHLRNGGSLGFAHIYICPICGSPTLFDAYGNQEPSPVFGASLQHLPASVGEIYNEARNCMSVNAFHASVMLCRKLLMHVAVDQGAKVGESFKSYVDYLEQTGVITSPLKPFANHVRELGNEANHEIKAIERSDAEELIRFLEMILRTTYVYPEMLRQKATP